MKIEACHIAGILRRSSDEHWKTDHTTTSVYLADALNHDLSTRQKVDELQMEIDAIDEEHEYALKHLEQGFANDMGRLDGEMAVLMEACPHTMFKVATDGMNIPICDICNGVIEEEVMG